MGGGTPAGAGEKLPGMPVSLSIRKFMAFDVTMPQGTYMIFLDCTEYCRETGKTLDDVINAGWDVGIGWQDGRHFGGNCHIRMNLALPLSQIEKVCMLMSEHVF